MVVLNAVTGIDVMKSAQPSTGDQIVHIVAVVAGLTQ